MLRISLVLVVLLSLVTGAVAGDPNDEQDSMVRVDGFFTDVNCASAIQYPDCQPCWFTCLNAMIMDSAIEGDWDWF